MGETQECDSNHSAKALCRRFPPRRRRRSSPTRAAAVGPPPFLSCSSPLFIAVGTRRRPLASDSFHRRPWIPASPRRLHSVLQPPGPRPSPRPDLGSPMAWSRRHPFVPPGLRFGRPSSSPTTSPPNLHPPFVAGARSRRPPLSLTPSHPDPDLQTSLRC